MNKVIIDRATHAKLADLTESAEIQDETGRILGYYTPAHDRSLYEAVEPPISEEELDRREQEGGGRTLAEILSDLEDKA